jgi:AcrR family transcriptional regulator
MDEKLILQEVRPTRADALKNRELLLETAQRLFSEQGVDAVSMSALAQAAGVGKGTLYRHFPNKSELLEVLIDADQRDLQERTLRRLRAVHDDPLGNLRWFLGEALSFVQRNRELFFSAMTGGTGTFLGHPAHLWWRQTIRGLLNQIKPALDLDYAADVLYVMLDARTLHFQQSAFDYSDQRILDGMYALLDHLIA